MQYIVFPVLMVLVTLTALSLSFFVVAVGSRRSSSMIGNAIATLLMGTAFCHVLAGPSPFSQYIGDHASSVLILAELGSKAATYLIIVIVLVGAGFALVAEPEKSPSSKTGVRYSKLIALSFVAVLFALILAAVFGFQPIGLKSGEFRKLFFFPAALLLLWVYRRALSAELMQSHFFYWCSFLSAVSLFLMVTAPAAVTVDGTQYIPGLSFRLSGVLGQPTGTGFTCATAVLVGLFIRPRTWLVFVCMALNFSAMVLAQSKGAIGGFLIVAVIALIDRGIASAKISAVKGIAFGIATAVTAALVYFGVRELGVALSNKAFSEITTLTGRIQIWEISLEAWNRNPIFGYGLQLWSEEFRRSYAPESLQHVAGMAHNQFVQTLAESGIIGLGCLIIHLCILLLATFDARRRGSTLAVSLFFLTLIRCFTEAPLRNYTITFSAIPLLILYGILLLQSRRTQETRSHRH